MCNTSMSSMKYKHSQAKGGDLAKLMAVMLRAASRASFPAGPRIRSSDHFCLCEWVKPIAAHHSLSVHPHIGAHQDWAGRLQCLLPFSTRMCTFWYIVSM